MQTVGPTTEELRRLEEKKEHWGFLSGPDAMAYAQSTNRCPHLGAAYEVPARPDNYDGGFWRYTTVKRGRVSESDPTITERIQLTRAAPFSVVTDPSPIRYILCDGQYRRSLNAAQELPAKTILIRHRYIDADGELIEGTRTWPTRVGLYVLNEQMLRKYWRVIEVIPTSYERSTPSQREDLEFCERMLGVCRNEDQGNRLINTRIRIRLARAGRAAPQRSRKSKNVVAAR